MCRHRRLCTELGERPETWSRQAPLLPPAWFETELDMFADAVRAAATRDGATARVVLSGIRGDDLRAWYVEHCQRRSENAVNSPV